MPTRIMVSALILCVVGCNLAESAEPPANKRALPAQTSLYNVGNAPGRERGPDGKIKRFALGKADIPLFDGGGRALGRVGEPVMLNVGAGKRMDLDGQPGLEEYVWAWKTSAGSGWVARSALLDPPPFSIDTSRNPKAPAEAKLPVTINAAAGTKLLAGLRHVDSTGVIPSGGGNKGEHYTGRNPGPRDYVYLLFAVPNVQRGGVARDSIPDGGKFLPALDQRGNPIAETMTMYRDGDFAQPVPVTFLYGRAENGETYGWLARANVGER